MTDLTLKDLCVRIQPAKIEPDLDDLGMMLFQSNGMAGEAGEAANVVKKIVRDGETEDLIVKLLSECGDQLFYMQRLLERRGLSIEDAAEALLAKLARIRAERAAERSS